MKKFIFLIFILPFISGCLATMPFIQGASEEALRQRHYEQGIPTSPIQYSAPSQVIKFPQQRKISSCFTDGYCLSSCLQDFEFGYCQHICKTCN